VSSRTWIKIYCDKWLDGSISGEPIHVRGIWVSLLALAGNGKYGDSGIIKALEGVGFNDKQLAAMIKVSLQMWLSAKKRLIETGRITVSTDIFNDKNIVPDDIINDKNIVPDDIFNDKNKVATGNIITIANWKKYQSEYERTSKYRSNTTTNATTNDTALEDRGKRIDNIKEIYKESLPDWINKTTWADFLEMRKKLRKPPTERAKRELIKDLEKLKDTGCDVDEIILRSVKNGWLAFYPPDSKNVGRGKADKPEHKSKYKAVN